MKEIPVHETPCTQERHRGSELNPSLSEEGTNRQARWSLGTSLSLALEDFVYGFSRSFDG